MDLFTKWAEAKVLANIRDVNVKKFVWRNIITRFGVPESLVFDKGCSLTIKSSKSFVVTLV